MYDFHARRLRYSSYNRRVTPWQVRRVTSRVRRLVLEREFGFDQGFEVFPLEVSLCLVKKTFP